MICSKGNLRRIFAEIASFPKLKEGLDKKKRVFITNITYATQHYHTIKKGATIVPTIRWASA
jgi:hypothetical protein